MLITSDNPPTSYTPLDSPLPPPPEEDIFTPDQWTILLAIADTIIPSIRSSDSIDPSALSVPDSELAAARSHLQNGLDNPHSEESTHLITSYLEEAASSVPQFKDSLKAIFGRHVHHEARKGLSLILTALKYVIYSTLEERLTSH